MTEENSDAGDTPRILIVDDDPAFRRLSGLALERAGMAHEAVATASEALKLLQAAPPGRFDLLLLDMELPGMKGAELLEVLRARGRDIPVILVTVLEDVDTKVRVLDLGADDYVVKPCSFEELFSRLEAVLRRTRARRRIRVGDLEIEPVLRRVRRNGRPIDLTPREFELFATLVEGVGNVVSKDELVRRAWAPGEEPSANSLQVHFSHLKRKLDPMDPVRIETVYGVGYRLVAE